MCVREREKENHSNLDRKLFSESEKRFSSSDEKYFWAKTAKTLRLGFNFAEEGEKRSVLNSSTFQLVDFRVGQLIKSKYNH